jgi:signal transduction histidine kinase
MARRKKYGAAILVGELLRVSELISQEQLDKALPTAQKTGLPIGRVLVESGIVTEGVVRASVIAQMRINDNLLHPELAAKALRIVQQEGLPIEEALILLGWNSDYYERTNQLGELLLEAGCITEAQLSAGYEVCFASGLALTRVLVLRSALPEVLAYTALSAQLLIRDGTLPYSQAVDFVRQAANVTDLSKQTSAINIKNKVRLRLGELLVSSGAVNELDLISAVERCLVSEIQVGQALLQMEAITAPVLQIALEAQARLNAGLIDPNQAIQLVRTAINSFSPQTLSAQEYRQDGEFPNAQLGQLLRSIGLSESADLLTVVRELTLQKENLAFKVVSQDEELKTRLSRDLHDTIIADLMMLKRYLVADKKPSFDHVGEIVDDIVRQLRDICHDFSPRQLQELGLHAGLKEMLTRYQQRTAINCDFVFDTEIPEDLPEPVKLHVFRIVQECLNNIDKYAGASRVSIEIERPSAELLRISVNDNGSGFKRSEVGGPTTMGGMGISNLFERVELIRVYFPAQLYLRSTPGAGARITLELSVKTAKSLI